MTHTGKQFPLGALPRRESGRFYVKSAVLSQSLRSFRYDNDRCVLPSACSGRLEQKFGAGPEMQRSTSELLRIL